MTTKGDNRKQAREEAERLLLIVLPARLPAAQAEFDWALGLPTPAGFVTPEPWVRYAIRRFWDIPDDLAHCHKITREDVAGFFGYAQGLSQASEVALKQPVQCDDLPKETAEKIKQFQERMFTAMQPNWSNLRQALAQVPEGQFVSSLSEVVACHDGQKFASSFVRDAVDPHSPDGSNTKRIQWFLWMLWPELRLFQSVAELHSWFARTRFVFCSQKLVEKTCTAIGFRPGTRGRKKRIPTPAR